MSNYTLTEKIRSIILTALIGIVTAWVGWVTACTIKHGNDVVKVQTEVDNIKGDISYIRSRIDEALMARKSK